MRRLFLPPIRDPQDRRARERGNGRKFFISERRKCGWRQQAIDPGDDRGATAVLVAGRARGDDSAAPGRRRQATRGEHASTARRCQHPHPAGDTRFRDEVSRYRSSQRHLRLDDTENDRSHKDSRKSLGNIEYSLCFKMLSLSLFFLPSFLPNTITFLI